MSAATPTLAVPPPRTIAQRFAALERANEIRLSRANVKKQLRAGAIGLAEAIAHPDCQTAKIAELLLAMPGLGPIKVGRILADSRISHAKLAGGLTDRQRHELHARVAGDELPFAAPAAELLEHETVLAGEHETSISGLLA